MNDKWKWDVFYPKLEENYLGKENIFHHVLLCYCRFIIKLSDFIDFVQIY